MSITFLPWVPGAAAARCVLSETKFPSEGLQSWIGADDGELRVGKVYPDTGIMHLRHPFECLEHAVLVAKSCVNQCHARREVSVLRGQRLGVGAPSHDSVGVSPEVMTAGAALL